MKSGCRTGERWSTPTGSVRCSAISSETFDPSRTPPVPGLAPWPTTISIACAIFMWSGLKPYRDGSTW